MYKETNGPILSRGNTRRENRKAFFKKLFYSILIALLWVFSVEGNDLTFDDPYIDEYEEMYPVYTEEELGISEEESEIIEELEVEEAIVEKEKKTVDFYYNRATQREKQKDYQGAVEDYTKTIQLAKKYSAEMWNSLNNRGIIRAQQLRDYKGAMADFNQIIETEINRYDGEINVTRLEAGYLNRAYVKKIKGDKEGACDDLYEALYYAAESSQAFIEKQIDKNCL